MSDFLKLFSHSNKYIIAPHDFNLNSLNDQRGFPGGAVVKNPPVGTGDARDVCLILGSGRSSGGGNGNPL